MAVYYPRRRLSSPDTARGFQARTSDKQAAGPQGPGDLLLVDLRVARQHDIEGGGVERQGGGVHHGEGQGRRAGP